MQDGGGVCAALKERRTIDTIDRFTTLACPSSRGTRPTETRWTP